MVGSDRSSQARFIDDKTRMPWSEDDLARLKAMIETEYSIPEIARALHRSQEGTRAKAAQNGWYATPRARAKKR